MSAPKKTGTQKPPDTPPGTQKAVAKKACSRCKCNFGKRPPVKNAEKVLVCPKCFAPIEWNA